MLIHRMKKKYIIIKLVNKIIHILDLNFILIKSFIILLKVSMNAEVIKQETEELSFGK